MALGTCKECGGIVSSNAKACPHCGSKSFDAAHSIGQVGNTMMRLGCLLLLLPFLLFALMLL